MHVYIKTNRAFSSIYLKVLTFMEEFVFSSLLNTNWKISRLKAIIVLSN